MLKPPSGPQRRPRLVHLTTTPVSLSWLLLDQLRAFRSAGFEVITASGPGEHREAVIDAGFEHREIAALTRRSQLASDLRAMRELTRFLSTCAPDIVHTHNPKPGIMGRVAGRVCGVPAVVNTVHGLYAQANDPWRRRVPVHAAERLAATCSDAELVQNVEDVATLRSLGIPSERVHLLGNGIDLERFRPTVSGRAEAARQKRSLGIPVGIPVVGMVGRLVWEKGHRDLFDAIRLLRARGSQEFAVVIAGPWEDGKGDAIDRDTIEDMKRSGVHFLGERSDIDVVLQMLDVFVLPSRREGFPRAAMEACAMGLPVVTTDIRGCRQVVRHQHNGFLYPVGDAARLAGLIELLTSDRHLRRGMGLAGMDRAAAEFDQRRVIDRTLAVYRRLLAERGWQPQPSVAANRRYVSSIDLVALEASNSAAEAIAPWAS